MHRRPGLVWVLIGGLCATGGQGDVPRVGERVLDPVVAAVDEKDEGLVYEARTVALPAGRHRLQFDLSAAPLPGLEVAPLTVQVRVGAARREVPLQLLGTSDAQQRVTLDFVGEGRMPVTVSWHMPPKDDELAAARRASMLKAAAAGSRESRRDSLALDDGLGDGFDGLGLDSLGQSTDEKLDATPHRIVLRTMQVASRPDVTVSALRTDRIVYQPGAACRVTLALRNDGTTPQDVALALDLRDGLDASTTLLSQTVRVPAGGAVDVPVPPVDTADLRWGCALEAQVATTAGATTTRTAFAVTDNFWDVHQYTFEGSLAAYDDPARARARAAELRDKGYTAVEALFWGPCDMFEYTPETEMFFGGQGAYPATIRGTSNFVAACHAEGIATTFYANWWGGSGPPAIEMMRQHPEWFANANYDTRTMDDWDLLGYHGDMRGGEVRAPGLPWAFVPLTLRPFGGAFALHAREILASAAQFGWDAIRYDSGHSRTWNVEAMYDIRATVQRDAPGFRFAVNSFAPGDARCMQLVNFRGGCVMGEGLRLERKKRIAAWLDEVLTWRDLCAGYDVQVMPLYQIGGNEAFPSALDEVLSVAAHYAGGVHIGAHAPDTAYGNVSPFALRYAEWLWDTAWRPVAGAETVVAVPSDYAAWSPHRLTRARRTESGSSQLVMHLLNLPGRYAIYRPYSAAVPPALPATDVRVALPPGAGAVRARLLTPFDTTWSRPLEVTRAGDAARITLPEIPHWAVLVMEVDGPTGWTLEPSLREREARNLTQWGILGPFEGDMELSGFETRGPLPEGVPDLAAQHDTAAGRRGWVRWEARHPAGDGLRPVALYEALDMPYRPAVFGYAYAEVVSDADRDALLYVKADEAAAVWLNGDRVVAERMGEFRDGDGVHVPVALQAGVNRVLVRVSQKWGYWQFALRFVDPQRRPFAASALQPRWPEDLP